MMKTQLRWLPSALFTTILSFWFNAGLALNAVAADGQDGDKTEVLAKHRTVALFKGIAEHRCMGATGLCPDRCGASGNMANFEIVKYVAYEKLDEYGQDKTKRYDFLVRDNMGNLKISPENEKAVKALKPGDYGMLDWQHNYVTKNRFSTPVDVITQLKKVTKEETEKLEPAPGKPAAQ
ncbi:MAG: hypothetical protein ACKO2G_08180 [Verrucomicrobiales bacterium]